MAGKSRFASAYRQLEVGLSLGPDARRMIDPYDPIHPDGPDDPDEDLPGPPLSGFSWLDDDEPDDVEWQTDPAEA